MRAFDNTAEHPTGAVRSSYRAWLPELLLLVAYAALLAWRLGNTPPWWDEGWTAQVAKNLAEHGFYGRLLLGQPAPYGLEGSPILAGIAALSFRLFGFGFLQARLPVALATLGALALLYWLARQLYNRGVARGALLVLLLLPIYPQFHVLVLGRQLLGEMPQLCLLLAGYAALLAALRGGAWWLALAALCWALALMFKSQYLAFWAISLALPSAVVLLHRSWRAAAMLGAGLAAAWLLRAGVLLPLQTWLLAGRSMPPAPLAGILRAVALVLEPYNRLYTLRVSLTVLLPSLLGVAWAVVRQLRRWPWRGPLSPEETLITCLLALVVAWWGWYVTLSVGAPRYVFPAIFVSSIFASALLSDLTAGFDWRLTLARAAGLLHTPRLAREKLGAALALALVVVAGSATLLFMSVYYTSYLEPSVERAAAWLNTNTPAGAVIETYDSELMPLLDRPYHYPPDPVHVALILRTSHHRDVPLDYDPLVANPDYLVVGEFSRGNQVYDDILASGNFRLIHHEGLYDIYARIR
jgi:4-amino-4-deoxy-L-arabinose transferase-like glycosyltransferase